jgi:hypothetical protein
VVWSASATILEVEARTLADALQKPKKVAFRMVGLKVMKLMKLTLKTAETPNLLIMMLIRMSLGELSFHTI